MVTALAQAPIRQLVLSLAVGHQIAIVVREVLHRINNRLISVRALSAACHSSQ